MESRFRQVVNLSQAFVGFANDLTPRRTSDFTTTA